MPISESGSPAELWARRFQHNSTSLRIWKKPQTQRTETCHIPIQVSADTSDYLSISVTIDAQKHRLYTIFNV